MDNKISIGLALIVAAAASVFFLDYYFKKQGLMTNLTIGGVRISAEVADTLAKKYQGLSSRESLCENCGMLFAYEKPERQRFAMRGMKFPLDFIFVREGKIVEIWENVPAPGEGESAENIDSQETADQVIEVSAGFASDNSIHIGDPVKVDTGGKSK